MGIWKKEKYKGQLMYVAFSLLVIILFILFLRANGSKGSTINEKPKAHTKFLSKKPNSFEHKSPKRSKLLSSKKTNFVYSPFELEKLIKSCLKKSFPDLVFEIRNVCPSKFSFYTSDIKNRDYDNVCRGKPVEVSNALEFWTEQSYINDRIVEYQEYLEGPEPVKIKFSGPEELDIIHLGIEAEGYFIIHFSSNIVSKYRIFHEGMLGFSESVVDIDEDFFKRMQVLKKRKLSIVYLLERICELTNDVKTCEASKELKKFQYPIPDDFIKKYDPKKIENYDEFMKIWP
jgi:hypothetical protein